MVLLRIPTAVQPMTGMEGFKYQASVLHTLFVRDFAAIEKWRGQRLLCPLNNQISKSGKEKSKQ